jgi:hypothetical protein
MATPSSPPHKAAPASVRQRAPRRKDGGSGRTKRPAPSVAAAAAAAAESPSAVEDPWKPHRSRSGQALTQSAEWARISSGQLGKLVDVAADEAARLCDPPGCLHGEQLDGFVNPSAPLLLSRPTTPANRRAALLAPRGQTLRRPLLMVACSPGCAA